MNTNYCFNKTFKYNLLCDFNVSRNNPNTLIEIFTLLLIKKIISIHLQVNFNCSENKHNFVSDSCFTK